MWMEHPADQQINAVRLDEIQALDPALAAVACPFCLIMLEAVSSSRGLTESLTLRDIAEVVVAAL